MSAARTTARLLRLYPASWRDRYGDELETLILDMSGSERVPWRVRADVALAGGRERLRGSGLGGGSPDARVRGGAGLVLWAWALFVLAGMIVQKTSEHWQQALPARPHTAATVAFDSLVGVAIVAAVLVLAGIALTFPALGRFLDAGGWAQLRPPVIRAAVISGVVVAATIGLVVWAHGLTPRDRQGRDTVYALAATAWALLGAGALLAWCSAATRTAAHLSLSPAILRIEALLAMGLAAALAVMAAATAAWWVLVATVAPRALGGHVSAFVPQLVVAMVLMVAAVGLGGAGARQATHALPGLAGEH
jgi:uncharacterized membrane protein